MVDIIIAIVLGVLFVGGGIVFYVKNFATSKSKSNATAGEGGSVATNPTVSPVKDADKLDEKEDTINNGDRIKTPIEKPVPELEIKEL